MARIDKIRLDLDDSEYELLLNIINHNEIDSHFSENKKFKSLHKKIENKKIIKASHKKVKSALRATAVREKQAKAKIENAINILRFELRDITHYNIAKTAGVSYNTVIKYVTKEYLDTLNSYNNKFFC